jgi:hypothetical protein
MAGGNPPGPAAPVVAPVAASTSVPLFGGNKGGRKRLDGLKPGSPEAKEADRKKHALVEQRRRDAAAAAATPPPLPPAFSPATLPPPRSDSEKTLPPGAALVVVPSVEAPVLALAWEARDLFPVTENGVPLLEEMAARQIVAKAKRARLPKEIISEIERDSKWPEKSKRMLSETSGALAAKYLNKAGISAEYKVEVNFSVAVLTIAANHLAILRRLDKLIAAANVNPAPPPPDKKS